MSRPVRALAGVLLAAILALPGSARAATTQDAAALADRLAERWTLLQRPDGTFPDSIRPGTHDWGRYGEAGIGYGLELAGVRAGRPDWIEAGARAQVWAATRAPDRLSVFETMMLASGYNLLRARAPATPTFAAGRAVLEAYLRDVPPVHNARLEAPQFASNKYLVEAVASLELARTGLVSVTPGAMLSVPGDARRRGLLILNHLVPARVAASRGRAAGHRVSALSDRERQPPAYHALVTGLVARALELAGPAASRRARAALRIGVRTAWALQAPDGDLAYFGRSSEQAWALAFAAFAAGRAAPPGCRRTARELLAVGARATGRLLAEHPLRPGTGLVIVPSADGPATVPALDDYASEVVYNGLTMTGLEWGLERPRLACRGGRLLADRRRTGAVLPFERSRFAVLRRGRVWMAVKQDATGRDPRAAFGLRALKYRAPGGRWRDLVPPAPPAQPGTEGVPGGALELLRDRRAPARAVGTAIRVRAGRVLVRGGFREPGGRWVRRGITFAFRAVRRGVRITVPARRADRVVLGVLSAGRPVPTTGGARSTAAVAGGRRAAAISLSGPFAGSTSLDVWRTALAVRPARGRATFTIRVR